MIFLVWELIIVVGVLFLDMLTKGLAESWLTTLPGNTFPIIEDVLHLTFVRNTGAAFSMLEGQRVFFVVTAIVASIIMVAFLIFSKNPSKLLRTGIALMLSGTIGNSYDRIVWGSVRDMIDFRLINFAVFNIADTALCIGVALIIVYVIFIYKEPDKKKKEELSDVESSGEDENGN